MKRTLLIGLGGRLLLSCRRCDIGALGRVFDELFWGCWSVRHLARLARKEDAVMLKGYTLHSTKA